MDSGPYNGVRFDFTGSTANPGEYWLIYRNGANDRDYRLVGVLDSKTSSFKDITPDSQRGPALELGRYGPHADTLTMAFIGNPLVPSSLRLIEADDGVIYQLTNPNSVATDYSQSLDGNLGDLETWSAAYDPLGNVAIAGNQDNYSIAESHPNPKRGPSSKVGTGQPRRSPSLTRTRRISKFTAIRKAITGSRSENH